MNNEQLSEIRGKFAILPLPITRAKRYILLISIEPE